MSNEDVIDALVGAHAVDSAEQPRREVAREQAQRSYDTLFHPRDASHMSVAERFLVAAFATRLTANDETAAYYAAEAAKFDAEIAARVTALAEASDEPGPYGIYPEAGLQNENVEGTRVSRADERFGAHFEPRLAAALAHAHLLVKRPRETTGSDHSQLYMAGWSTDGIVTLSQLIAFLAFQQRVVIGLRALKEAGA